MKRNVNYSRINNKNFYEGDFLPRFDREGFNPEAFRNNDRRDRSVPQDENYYGNGYDSDSGDIIDNQNDFQSYVDINSYIDSFSNNTPAENLYANHSRENYSERSADRIISARDNKKPSRKGSNRGKKPNISKSKAIIISVISFILIIAIIAGSLINSVLNKITYDEQRENKYIAADKLESDSKVKNILLLGVDARNEKDKKKSRADSMMLISIDSNNNCIKMVSFLRDTWVYIPAHNGEQRLNAACSYDGYDGVVDTIEYNFGIDIDGYVIADFNMFKVLVDSIGGVEVEVTEKEAKEVTNHKKRYGNVKLEAGKHKLTGKQALAYCRIRKIDTDFMRAKRQRTVMQSIIKGVKKSGPVGLYQMASDSSPYIETNLTKSQLMSIATSALGCMGEMVETKVPFDGTWKYENIRGNSVITIDKGKNKKKLIDYIYKKTPQEIKDSENKKN